MRVVPAAALLAASLAAACASTHEVDSHDGGANASSTPTLTPSVSPTPSSPLAHSPPARLANRIAYIPPACFARTRSDDGRVHNACYTCHSRSDAPNFTNDDALQRSRSFPPLAATNPWTNLVDPPVARAASRLTDDAVLAYVRQSNYFDAAGAITLARALAKPPADWDANHDGRWEGFVPDAYFAFDARGFDHAPDGTFTGWRAFAYYPTPGAFFPTNGSMGDALVRLAPSLREDTSGHFDARVYETNLAIVEALVRRADVAIDPTNEATFGVDLDLDGALGTATKVAFDAGDGKGSTRMHYVGHARDDERAGNLPIAPGMLPVGTELLHTVRYIDVGPDGAVRMAARMKEVRYAKKTQWSTYAIARANAIREAREQEEMADGTHEVRWAPELGVLAARGWLLQGFIEAEDGALRPQTFEETAYCEGCHGGLGVTTDATFSLARKLGKDAPARGWFHPSQHDLRGVAEPKRADGAWEYALYLKENGGGDDWRANDEVRARFFDAKGELVADAIEKLHGDVSTLLLPSPGRALDLDRAYVAIVKEQSFAKGREALLAPSPNVLARVTINEATGVTEPVDAKRLAVR